MRRMSAPFAVVIGVLVFLIGVLAIFFVRLRGRETKKKDRPAPKRDRNQILKDANRQLSQNPRDHHALRAIADLYYEERAWEKAMKTYGILINLCATQPEIEEWDVTMRYGLCALQLKQHDEAYKSLLVARGLNDSIFEVNYNLGYLEYRRGNLDRAIQLLRQSHSENSEHIQTRRYLGRALAKQKNYTEAIALLRTVVDVEPDDKESLFVLAQSYHETGQTEQALMIFTHLRADSRLGPHAALFSGTIHASRRENDQAALDFELGLRHETIRQDIALELRYRLAVTYMQQQEIGKALAQFQELYKVEPAYKDVAAQIGRAKELNSNKHLRTYLIAPTSEFVTLCRQVAMNFYKNAKVKIVDISVHKNDYADILADIETAKWMDVVLFRFVRGTGQVGELVLREQNSRIKELRAGRGFCLTAGTFTESAHAYVEARLIDLLDKEQLIKVFNRME